MRSPPSSIELFFAAKVIAKHIAKEYIKDSSGHSMIPNEPYITVHYLEKVKEMKNKIKYKLVDNSVNYIHLGEIFSTNINVSDDLCIDMEEYQGVCAELY